MKSSRNILALGFAGLTMIAFQNCGQPGQLTTAAPSSGVFANSLVISPPSTDSGGPSIPASSGGSHTDPTVASRHGGEPDDQDNDGKDDDDKDYDDDKDKDHDDDKDCGCDHIKSADLLLNIHQIMAGDVVALSITDLDHSISVDKTKLHVKALISTDLKEIRLVLNDDGNYLMSSDQSVHDLKTPSGQSSGFKIKFSSPVHIVAGAMYELDLKLDLGSQIVEAGKKCLLKPVVKSAVLNPL